MSFLAPLFFVGLLAVGIPVLVHLIQRERKDVVHFPSLMFIRRIPYQSVQRRRIHNWWLLLLRAAAMVLLAIAFARPFFRQDLLSASALSSGAREVVILLDRSASMGYADRWDRARAEARKVVDGLSGEDRATLVLFGTGAEENVRATSDRGLLTAGINDATVTSDGTRFAPALRLAQSLLSRSALPRKEAVLISDFQKTGWERREEIRLPEGAVLTPITVATSETSNLSISTAAFDRKLFSGEERVSVTTGLTNRGATPFANLPVTLEVDGHQVDSRTISLAPNSSGSVTFTPFTVSDAGTRGVVRAGSDAMPKDNAFNFVLSPGRPVSVLVVEGDGASADADFFLTTALSIGTSPAFKTDAVAVSRVAPTALERRQVVVLNDVTAMPAPIEDLLKRFVEQGGGLWMALGEHTPWAAGTSPLMPGKLGQMVDRTIGVGGTLGFIDHSHAIFELFKQPHSGDFTAVHFLRYRTLTPEPSDRVLARFDDGAAALVERRVGNGRVVAFTSTLSNAWNDFGTKPVFLPMVLQLSRYLAHYDEPTAWYTVGRMLDVSAPVDAMTREGASSVDAENGTPRKLTGIVMTPGGKQVTIGGGSAQPSIELADQGFYTIRLQGIADRRPYSVAVNLDPAESDLEPMEPHEFVGSATGRAALTPTGQSLEHPNLTVEDMERKQNIWWFLMVAGVAMLLAESVLSNRLSGKFGAGLVGVRK